MVFQDNFFGSSGHVSFDSCEKRKNVTVFVDEYLQGESKQVGIIASYLFTLSLIDSICGLISIK